MSEAVQELRQSGILVEESRELLSVLADHPEISMLLRGVATMLVHRLPMARLLLYWYVDPEVSGDEYPVLVVRLPSYDDDQLFLRLVEAIRDANLILDASPVWVLATSDFGVVRDGENRIDAGDTRIVGGA